MSVAWALEASGTDVPPLLGRATECATLAGLLAAARSDLGGALLIRGAPGTGRTTLLDWLPNAARDFLDLHCAGSPTETAVPGGALHQLLGPVASLADGLELSGPQRDALDVLLGRAARPLDPLVAATAVLALLRRAGRDTPVLCRVDDAHLLDPVSLGVLGVIGRRVRADPILLVLARTDRPGIEPGSAPLFEPDSVSVSELVLGPLGPADSRALLERLPLPPEARAPDRLAPAAGIPDGVATALTALAHGNPLALVELAGALTRDQISGLAPPPTGLPPGSRLRAAHRRLVEAQQPGVREVLLLCAAAPRLDEDVLLAVGERVGIGAALAAAERLDLVRVTAGRAALADPLLGASVYATATAARRRDAHQLLAAAMSGERHRADRAWPRAAAAAAATGAEAVRRLLGAARAAWLSGDGQRARALLARADAIADSAELHDLVELQHAEIEVRSGTTEGAFEALAAVAADVQGPQRGLAVMALLRATEVSGIAGEQSRFFALARRIASMHSTDDQPATQLMFDLFAGLSAAYRGDQRAATRPLRRVLELAPLTHDPLALTLATSAAITLADEAASLEMAGRAVAEARLGAARAHLPVALEFLAFAEFWTDRYGAATAHSAEGLRLARERGQDNSVAAHLAIQALLSAVDGRSAGALELATAATRQATGRGLTRPDAMTRWAATRLALATGRADEAAAALGKVSAGGVPGMHPHMQVLATPDLVEAAVLHGDRSTAAAMLGVFEGWASGTGSAAMRALAARCGALLATVEDEAAARFQQALSLHAEAPGGFERARTRFLYGQALRRARRRATAREQLHEALADFERLNAAPWAERTRAELRVAGGAATAPAAGPANLTPQQWEVARLVSAGATNREVAARLYLSPRTVEHHLRNIFARLGLRSRVELTRLLSSPHEPAE
jgi:DNA-binding NarL/FixJ family response regulator